MAVFRRTGTVIALRKCFSHGKLWFECTDMNGKYLGWVDSRVFYPDDSE